MNGIGTNYPQHNYYNPDLESNTSSVTQQETNIPNNTFSPLFISQQHCEDFKRDINTEDLISYLYGKCVISEEQYDCLSVRLTNRKRTNLVVDILTNKLLGCAADEAINLIQTISDAVYEGCNQPFLTATLNPNIENCFIAGQVASNMSANTQFIASNGNNLNLVVISPLFANKENYEAFKEDVDIDSFISCIYGDYIISEDQYDELCVKLTRYQKVDLLVDMLNDKLINATAVEASDIRNNLANALCDSCNQPFLVSFIN